MTTAIVNGQYVDVNAGRLVKGDLLLEDGLVKALNVTDVSAADEIVDAAGLVISPAFVDMHVHLRDPGLTHKEDVFSGADAAAAGGYTAVCCMPNTKPSCDCPEVVSEIINKAKTAKCRVFPVGAITKGLEGNCICDFSALQKAGAAAVSDDGRPVFDNRILQDAMVQCADLKLPVLLHCEDLSITGKGIMHQGDVSEALGVAGVHRSSEDVSTAAAVTLAADTHTACHICHVSTAGSLALIREAKARGAKVTCEVTPHHMMLTHQLLRKRDANYRMAPPLREISDVNAVIAALCDGTADCIATDHAPHTAEEKADFEKAPNGIVGLETAFGVAYTTLVASGLMPLPELIRKMSTNPARILGLPLGRIEVGAPADLTLLDVHTQWTVDPTKFHSKSKNTAFEGITLQGRVVRTILNGVTVFSHKGEAI